MDTVYDEIISENPFFVELKNEYSSLYQHCINKSWIICVPRISSFLKRVFSAEDFCAHILVPSEELPETHYSTLTEKQVTVINKVITVEINNSLPLQSHILFEETFYTEDFLKFKVWCVETPLEPASIKGEHTLTSLEQLMNVNDCIELLWTQSAGRQVLEQIEHCVKIFLHKYKTMPSSIGSLSDAVGQLYTQCSQIALQNRRLRDKSKLCKQTMDSIKLSVETYMQHLIFDKIFKSICTCAGYEDSHLNKTIRNLADIQLRDLDIRKDLYSAIPKARRILSKLNSCKTILEKILCLKNTLNAVNKVEIAKDNYVLLTADDLIPVFVFLVIKSGLPNWYSQLTYMKEFRFSARAKGIADETAFLVTTLEAVIEYIMSGVLIGSPNPESYYYEHDHKSEDYASKRRDSTTESNCVSNILRENTLDNLFELIKLSNYDEVKDILEKNKKLLNKIDDDIEAPLDIKEELEELFQDDDKTPPQLCHPLCNCRKCSRTISKKLMRTSPTVSSRDSHGLTALHIAGIHGKANIVELLLTMATDIDATDLNDCTALHYSAARGHQNALLLLLHSGADMNKVNMDLNTPLHLATNNGHLNCVKALIYFAEHCCCNLHVNCGNENGDTPLHLAAKWGYEGIAKILIENGAEPSLQNKKNKTAFDYAHNFRILHILQSCSPNLYEFIHISSGNNVGSNNLKKKQDIVVKERNEHAEMVNNSENIKRIERILQAISYGDVKLACFFMNIHYPIKEQTSNVIKDIKPTYCHPLCECETCNKIEPSIEEKPAFDINFADSNGNTALHFASRYGSNELCEILLHSSANINSVNKKGQTPLHLASLHNKVGTVQLLLKYGAHVNARNIAGDTALHDAVEMGNIGTVKILLQNNPNLTIKNGIDKTALDIAKDKVYLTIIDLIDKFTDNNLET